MTGAGGADAAVRTTRVVIDLDAIEHNVGRARKLVGPDVEILAVVKADAYGHGAVPAARACERAGAAALGVALVQEGVELRRAAIALPILVQTLADSGEIDALIENRLMPTIATLDFARELSQKAKAAGATIDVHADINTGMGRIGFEPKSAVEEIVELNRLPNLRLDGLYTHFSTSEIEDDPWTLRQLEIFKDVTERLSQVGVRPSRLHAANSGGVINYPAAHLTLVRPGLMLYGVYPGPGLGNKIDLKPAMRFETSVAFLKKIEKGAPLGYGKSFVAAGPMRVATANVGYADGYPWRLSNNASALIRATRVPVVGRVSMDQLILDVSSVPEVAIGDTITLMGSDGPEQITADDLAHWAGTISYEILCALGAMRR